MLRFEGAWRFQPPADGNLKNREIPSPAVDAFISLIFKVATQGNRQAILERYKGEFCRVSGSTHVWSSSESWTETDLNSYAQDASHNAPLFLEAFYDASESLRRQDPNFVTPDVCLVNRICVEHDIGYELRPPDLLLRDPATSSVTTIPERTPTLAETANQIMQSSLRRSDELLVQGHAREAVQELLWLLESVSTAFKGLELPNEKVVEGKYFNQIVRDLQNAHSGTSLERVLDWVTTFHGYLSSPTGGGIRHGMDVNSGVAVGLNDARLFCNLIRSYLSYLLSEHEKITRQSNLTRRDV